MEKKEGKIPVNARVDIDYSGEKPEIKFGYTEKNVMDQAYRQNRLSGYRAIIFILVVDISFIFLFSWPISDGSYPKSCNVSFDQSNYTLDSNGTILNIPYNGDIRYMNISCDTELYQYKFMPTRTILKYDNPRFEIYYPNLGRYLTDVTVPFFGTVIFIFLMEILVLWFINLWITDWLLKSKWYHKWLPKHNAGGKNRKKQYYKFYPKDVQENVVIIPSFKNVELIYKTKGEFSKNLQKIKIREQRYYDYKKGKKKGKVHVENYKWYAMFFFSSPPKDGWLEVIYQ